MYLVNYLKDAADRKRQHERCQCCFPLASAPAGELCLLSASENASGCLQQDAGGGTLPFLLSKRHQLSHRHLREGWGLWFWPLA